MKLDEIISYELETNGEKSSFFLIKYEKENDFYAPFLTSTIASISTVIDHLDFAEKIQDSGVKYSISTNSISFETKEDAEKAANILNDIVMKIHKKSDVSQRIHEYNRNHMYGMKHAYKEEYEAITGKEMTDKESQELLNMLYAVSNRSLNVETNEGAFNIHSIDIKKMEFSGTSLEEESDKVYIFNLEDMKTMTDVSRQEVIYKA